MTQPYYPDRWNDYENKVKAAKEFIENPGRESFAELLEYLWAMEARFSHDYYMDDIVFEEQTPEQVAEAIQTALENPDKIKEVNDLDGFGYATSTEILQALDQETYAIMNKRSIDSLETLGYSPPSRQSATVEDYWSFVDDVKDAVEKYPLRRMQDEDPTVPDVPEWASDLVVADAAFNAHYDQNSDFTLTSVKERNVREIELDEALYQTISEKVEGNPMYRDVEDFVYSAIRNEL